MILYVLCQFILVNYISPLLDENYLANYWDDGIQYIITVIAYLAFCLAFSVALIVLQIYFLRVWCFRLNDIGINNYLRFLPVLCFVILLINNFYILSPWVVYFYYFVIFLSAIPKTDYFISKD